MIEKNNGLRCDGQRLHQTSLVHARDMGTGASGAEVQAVAGEIASLRLPVEACLGFSFLEVGTEETQVPC